jgi:predicted alpha/beta superfamily hydrolase
MKKLHFLILLIGMPCFLLGQIKIRVTSLPLNTPPDAKVFIAGSFDDWDRENPDHQLIRQSDGSYSVVIIAPEVASISYRFYIGNDPKNPQWEGSQDGGAIENRLLLYLRRPSLESVSIVGWENKPSNATADMNVRILAHDFLMPQFQQKRRIWIYLPPNYYADTTKTYPVLYMQHGQHLFTVDSSGAEEWRIDETLNALASKGDKGCIVVGIDGQNKSTSEYAPWQSAKNPQSDGQNYAKFIVETLKPFVDAQFRTKRDRANTGVGGSKEGAILSLYMAAEYPLVFSKAAIFSPTFSDADASLLHIQKRGKQKYVRYCIVAGSDEDVAKTEAIEKMVKTLRGVGHSFDEVKVIKKIDGEPTEWFWSREFKDAYKWLFKELPVNAQEGIFDAKVQLTTNIEGSVLNINLAENVANSNALIFDTNQKLLFTVPVSAKKTLDINFLTAGKYLVHCVRGEDLLFVKDFTKNK